MANDWWNVSPQAGVGAYPLVPGALNPITTALATSARVGNPTTVTAANPYSDLSALIPNLQGATNAARAFVGNELAGNVDVGRIQDAAAARATASGMPGFNPGSLGTNAFARNYGLDVNALKGKGLTDYANLLNTVSKTQTVSPELQAQIAQFNANLKAAAEAQNASFQQNVNLANAGATNRTNEFNSGIANTNSINAAAASPEAQAKESERLFNAYLDKVRGATGGGSPFRSIQGGGGQTGLGTPATHTANGFAVPAAPVAPGGVFSGTGQGVIGLGGNVGGGGVLDGGGSTWSPADLAFTGLDESQSWTQGNRDPFQQFQTSIPQSGTPNRNWWEQLNPTEAWA